MPYFMDIHRGMDGVAPEEVVAAHEKDVEVQSKYGVAYHKYWFDPKAGAVYCFVEGPDEEACHAVHREAHGLVADELIEVESHLVDAFLGDGEESSEGAVLRPSGTLDPAFRVLLATCVENLPLVATRWGDEAAVGLVGEHDDLVRDCLRRCGGREVRHNGAGILASFFRPSSALRCAVLIQEAAAAAERGDGTPPPAICVGMTAGQPVERDETLFGVSIALAERLCNQAAGGEILISDAVRELALGTEFRIGRRGSVRCQGFDEPVGIYELRWNREEEEEPAVGKSDESREALPADPAPTLPSLWERTVEFGRELRRRKVFRVTAVYLAVAFVVLQVAQLTFDPLGLPPWAYTLVLVLAILGFPLALVLAWAFEVTPEGRVVSDETNSGDRRRVVSDAGQPTRVHTRGD